MKKIKLILILMVFASSAKVFADPSYTLVQICDKYSDDINLCSSIPFCKAQVIPAQPAGCHAKPEYSYMEGTCQIVDPSLCNPEATACQMYNASAAQVTCLPVRLSL